MATLQQVASDAFPMLVDTATNQSTITYGDLAAQIGTSAYLVLPRALGHIWSWLRGRGLPSHQRPCRLAQDQHPGPGIPA